MNSQHFSTPEPTPRGNTSAQDLHLELVRHCADVLRMLTARVPAPGPPAPPAAAPSPVQEAPEAQLEEAPASWEEASGYLHARDFRRGEVVHLWLQLLLRAGHPCAGRFSRHDPGLPAYRGGNPYYSS